MSGDALRPGAEADVRRRRRLQTEPSPLDPLPICLACWRERFGLDAELPPPPHDWPEEWCELCSRRTTHGLYLLRGKA